MTKFLLVRQNLNDSSQNKRISYRFQTDEQYLRQTIIRKLSIDYQHSNIQNYEELKIKQIKKSQQEYALQKSLQNESVLQNIAFYQNDTQIVFIQQDYDYLLSQIELSPLPIKCRLKIFHDVVQGVKYLKDNLICHRAISPQNICIVVYNDNFHSKINNFQAAITMKDKKSETRVSLMQKTTICSISNNAFISPEIKLKQPQGLMTDVWSLGVLLNYLLYETTDNIHQKGVSVQVAISNNTPQWLSSLLKGMLQYDPNKRTDIASISDLIKVSLKCTEAMSKYIPFGKSCFRNK